MVPILKPENLFPLVFTLFFVSQTQAIECSYFDHENTRHICRSSERYLGEPEIGLITRYTDRTRKEIVRDYNEDVRTQLKDKSSYFLVEKAGIKIEKPYESVLSSKKLFVPVKGRINIEYTFEPVDKGEWIYTEDGGCRDQVKILDYDTEVRNYVDGGFKGNGASFSYSTEKKKFNVESVLKASIKVRKRNRVEGKDGCKSSDKVKKYRRTYTDRESFKTASVDTGKIHLINYEDGLLLKVSGKSRLDEVKALIGKGSATFKKTYRIEEQNRELFLKDTEEFKLSQSSNLSVKTIRNRDVNSYFIFEPGRFSECKLILTSISGSNTKYSCNSVGKGIPDLDVALVDRIQVEDHTMINFSVTSNSSQKIQFTATLNDKSKRLVLKQEKDYFSLRIQDSGFLSIHGPDSSVIMDQVYVTEQKPSLILTYLISVIVAFSLVFLYIWD
ncbi:MAG: hypothetical protein ABEK16_02365 [Candidatus Nanohalobium sp.]